MSSAFIISTFFEIAAVLLLVWGYFNEDKLIDFEDKFAWLVAAYIRKTRKKKAMKKHIKASSSNQLRSVSKRNLNDVVYNTTEHAA